MKINRYKLLIGTQVGWVITLIAGISLESGYLILLSTLLITASGINAVTEGAQK